MQLQTDWANHPKRRGLRARGPRHRVDHGVRPESTQGTPDRDRSVVQAPGLGDAIPALEQSPITLLQHQLRHISRVHTDRARVLIHDFRALAQRACNDARPRQRYGIRRADEPGVLFIASTLCRCLNGIAAASR